MKRILSALLLACAAGLTLSGQVSVVWNELTHNFGAFDEDDGPVTFDFVFVNTGSEPVAVTAARPSCGCTAPRFSLAPVAPGDSGTVSVTYDPQGRPGRFDKYVAVDFSEAGNRVKLHVVGTVVGATGSVERRYPVLCGGQLRLSHGAVMFGEVLKDRMSTSYITAYNGGHDTLRPALGDLPPFLSGTFEPAAIPPGEQATLMLFFRSDRTPLYGLVADSIWVEPGKGERCALAVTALVKEDFARLTPGQLQKAPRGRLESTSVDFGILSRTRAPETRAATLHNEGSNTLTVRRIYTTDPGITATIDKESIKKGKSATISVTVDPSRLPGSLLNARINIITNDPDNPVRQLRAVGKLR